MRPDRDTTMEDRAGGHVRLLQDIRALADPIPRCEAMTTIAVRPGDIRRAVTCTLAAHDHPHHAGTIALTPGNGDTIVTGVLAWDAP